MRTVISALAYAKIVHHSSKRNTEVIGLLIGRKTENALEIGDVFTGAQSGTAVYAALDHNVQARLAESLHTHANNYIVGWYHSHPRIGVFMSGTDIETQNAYQAIFPEAVALVIDPAEYFVTRDPLSATVKIFQVANGSAREVEWTLEKRGDVKNVMKRLESDRRWLRQMLDKRTEVKAEVIGSVAFFLGLCMLLFATAIILLYISGMLAPLIVESGIETEYAKWDSVTGLIFSVILLFMIISIGKFFVKIGASIRKDERRELQQETD